MPTTDAPALVLLCMGPCHGEFYLPLDKGEQALCPNDPAHAVAVYGLKWQREAFSEPIPKAEANFLNVGVDRQGRAYREQPRMTALSLFALYIAAIIRFGGSA